MYPDLPPHLQTLNSIPSSNSPPSSAWNQEDEEGLWSFLRTDDIFGPSLDAHHPSPDDIHQKQSPEYVSPVTLPATHPTPASGAQTPGHVDSNLNGNGNGVSAPTLESFLATFANSSQQVPALPQNYLLPLPLPYPTGVNTSDVMPPPAWTGSEYGDDATTKRLKKNGAGVAEIEEDKRRRNTEASARFRLKKKEREQALDKRAKDLEAQVSTLQTEKQALQSENKLLKYLLLKTGTQPSGESGEGLADVIEGLGKRKREIV